MLALLPDDLHQNPLPPPAIKLSVKYLFPGAEVEAAFGDGDDDFAAHDLALEMGVGVVLAGAVVVVVLYGLVGGEFLEPDFVVVVEAAFVVIDEDGGGDVHGIDEAEALLDAASLDELLDGVGDVEEAAAAGHLEPEVFGEGFHLYLDQFEDHSSWSQIDEPS